VTPDDLRAKCAALAAAGDAQAAATLRLFAEIDRLKETNFKILTENCALVTTCRELQDRLRTPEVPS
jgi:rRNA-processing protein FCF1